MRLVFFGAGAFGLPTLERLHRVHDVALVVSQPDRATGRGRKTTPTPISACAADHDLDLFTPVDPNDPAAIDPIRAVSADAWVIIAYGHKLGEPLLADTFAINLHGSLLPKYRGAAPINHAVINNEPHTGISVITLAQRMDAGDILATTSVTIDPQETAGELHDRLAELGPDLVLVVLRDYENDALTPLPQDHSRACPAPKFTKADGTVRFDQPAEDVRARIHGLTPWPGCTVELNGQPLKIRRAQSVSVSHSHAPGEILEDGTIACRPGRLRLLTIQPPGGQPMTFDAYRNGRPITTGMILSPLKRTVDAS